MAPAVSVTNLGKLYRLSHQSKRTDSFREAITSALMSPLRRLRQIRGTDETMEEFWALKDVSFDVQPGEVVGIIGRNGAGKSTLLKVLSRIVEPTNGEIRLRGRVASLLEVGTGFHPELTGRENIYLNGSILGMKKREIDRKFDEIVDFAEVEKFLDTPVKRYSSGMYVRLAFAVAAHLDPEILIVDEVLAVGDADFQKKCLGKMKEVATGTGRTVLFVSHNIAAIRSLCTRGIVLSHGSVIINSSAAQAVEEYALVDLNKQSESFVLFTRPPKAAYWIEKMEMLVNGRPSDVMLMGDDLVLRLSMRCIQDFRNPKIIIIISGEDSQRIIQFSNRFSTTDLKIRSEGSKITIRVASLPLCAGRYSFTLFAGDIGTIHQGVYDAMYFRVEERDVFQSGRIPVRQDGPVWIDAKLTCDDELEPSTQI